MGDRRLPMNLIDLPLEVLKKVFSHIGAARDIIRAASVCKKLHQMFPQNLESISFDKNDWQGYLDMPDCQLEMAITQTISQTDGLEDLKILMGAQRFSPAIVRAWLMHTAESLCSLHLCVSSTAPFIYLLRSGGLCRLWKLKILYLGYMNIGEVDPDKLQFFNLKFLSLSHVITCGTQLSNLISACPNVEMVELVGLVFPRESVNLTLASDCLKCLQITSFVLFGNSNFTLKAESLEKFQLIDCCMDYFRLVGKGTRTVKEVRFDQVIFTRGLYIDDYLEQLTVLEVKKFRANWVYFYDMTSRSSNLNVLRLADIMNNEEAEAGHVQLSSLCDAFPKLTHLSLCFESRFDRIHLTPAGGMYYFQNLEYLEVGWGDIFNLNDDFSGWVIDLLEHCNRLRELKISGKVFKMDRGKCRTLSKFMNMVAGYVREYVMQYGYVGLVYNYT